MAASGGQDPETASLQHRLDEKLALCEQLRNEIAAAHAERDEARRACTAGLQAAKVQMSRMRAELAVLRRRHAQLPGADEEVEAPAWEPAEAAGLAPLEEEPGERLAAEEALVVTAESAAAVSAAASAAADTVEPHATESPPGETLPSAEATSTAVLSPEAPPPYGDLRLEDSESAATLQFGPCGPACSAAPTLAEEGGSEEHLTLLPPAAPSAEPSVVGAAAVAPAAAPQVMDPDAERLRREALRLEARALRHELSKWKHQVLVLEGARPRREQELLQLQAELAHVHDLLESTKVAVRHHEVERHLLEAGLIEVPAGPRQRRRRAGSAPPFGGSNTNVEAVVERTVRERCEQKNATLSGKAKHLAGLLAAQQALARQLEEQLVQEECLLERKGLQLAHEWQLHGRLKGALRKRSDNAVLVSLAVHSGKKWRGAGESRSSSLPTLPPIDEKR